MIYKSNRSNTFIANCIMKNLMGFGKTEADALKNLEASIINSCPTNENIVVKPMYKLLKAQ